MRDSRRRFDASEARMFLVLTSGSGRPGLLFFRSLGGESGYVSDAESGRTGVYN